MRLLPLPLRRRAARAAGRLMQLINPADPEVGEDWDTIHDSSSFAFTARLFKYGTDPIDFVHPYLDHLAAYNRARDAWMNGEISRLYDEADADRAYAEATFQAAHDLEPELAARRASAEAAEAAMHAGRARLATVQAHVAALFETAAAMPDAVAAPPRPAAKPQLAPWDEAEAWRAGCEAVAA